ncbi:alpha/beta fold hydrolase [bacterium]|nr:alpha/beta fold hydrolase [bacterium]
MPFARVNGTMLYYREAGEGPLAVFIHGFPLDHSLWLDQLAGLGHVRRCVALDLRGFGRSDPTVESELSMELFADDVAGLIEALGEEQADIIGISMGGYVALALWELRPGLVRSLSLLDTRATADTPEAQAGRRRLAEQLLDDGRAAVAGQLTASLLAPGAGALVQARVRSMIEGTRYETLIASLDGMRNRPDRSRMLPGISVPTLVLGGEHDSLITPSQVRALAEPIPGARTAIITGAGHLPPLERPSETNGSLIELFEGRKVVWWRGGE